MYRARFAGKWLVAGVWVGGNMLQVSLIVTPRPVREVCLRIGRFEVAYTPLPF